MVRFNLDDAQLVWQSIPKDAVNSSPAAPALMQCLLTEVSRKNGSSFKSSQVWQLLSAVADNKPFPVTFPGQTALLNGVANALEYLQQESCADHDGDSMDATIFCIGNVLKICTVDYKDVFQPPLQNYVPFAARCIRVVNELVELSDEAKLSILLPVLSALRQMTSTQSNERKLFQLVLTHLLEPLLSTRCLGGAVDEIDSVLAETLFSPKNMSTFYQSLAPTMDPTDGKGPPTKRAKKVQPYTSPFFESFKSLPLPVVASSSTMLLHLFLASSLAFHSSRLSECAVIRRRELERARRNAEFAFFVRVSSALVSNESEQAGVLDSIASLYSAIEQHRIYNPNDKTQTEALVKQCALLLRRSRSPSLMKALCQLLHLSHSVIEAQLAPLLQLVVQGDAGSEQLWSTISASFAELRQLSILITAIVSLPPSSSLPLSALVPHILTLPAPQLVSILLDLQRRLTSRFSSISADLFCLFASNAVVTEATALSLHCVVRDTISNVLRKHAGSLWSSSFPRASLLSLLASVKALDRELQSWIRVPDLDESNEHADQRDVLVDIGLEDITLVELSKALQKPDDRAAIVRCCIEYMSRLTTANADLASIVLQRDDDEANDELVPLLAFHASEADLDEFALRMLRRVLNGAQSLAQSSVYEASRLRSPLIKASAKMIEAGAASGNISETVAVLQLLLALPKAFLQGPTCDYLVSSLEKLSSSISSCSEDTIKCRAIEASQKTWACLVLASGTSAHNVTADRLLNALAPSVSALSSTDELGRVLRSGTNENEVCALAQAALNRATNCVKEQKGSDRTFEAAVLLACIADNISDRIQKRAQDCREKFYRPLAMVDEGTAANANDSPMLFEVPPAYIDIISNTRSLLVSPSLSDLIVEKEGGMSTMIAFGLSKTIQFFNVALSGFAKPMESKPKHLSGLVSLTGHVIASCGRALSSVDRSIEDRVIAARALESICLSIPFYRPEFPRDLFGNMVAILLRAFAVADGDQASNSSRDRVLEAVNAMAAAMFSCANVASIRLVLNSVFSELQHDCSERVTAALSVMLHVFSSLRRNAVSTAFKPVVSSMLRILATLTTSKDLHRFAEPLLQCLHGIAANIQCVELRGTSVGLILQALLPFSGEYCSVSSPAVFSLCLRTLLVTLKHRSWLLYPHIAPFVLHIRRLLNFIMSNSNVPLEYFENVARICEELSQPEHSQSLRMFRPALVGQHVRLLQKHRISVQQRRALLSGLLPLVGSCSREHLLHVHSTLDTDGRVVFQHLHKEFDRVFRFRGEA